MTTQNVDSGGDAPTDPIHLLARLEMTAAIDGPAGRWSFEMIQGDDPARLDSAGITSSDPEAVLRAVFSKAANGGRC